MMKDKRTEEWKRLVWYAKGMGVTVRLRPYIRGSKESANWVIDDDKLTITIYQIPQTSKLQYVLTLIHELGHHKDFIRLNRTIPHNENKLWDKTKFSKKDRKVVLDSEIRGTKYWEEIYRDTGCLFPIQRLFKQMELDIWMYQFFYLHGKNPKIKNELRKKKKELKRKHGC